MFIVFNIFSMEKASQLTATITNQKEIKPTDIVADKLQFKPCLIYNLNTQIPKEICTIILNFISQLSQVAFTKSFSDLVGPSFSMCPQFNLSLADKNNFMNIIEAAPRKLFSQEIILTEDQYPKVKNILKKYISQDIKLKVHPSGTTYLRVCTAAMFITVSLVGCYFSIETYSQGRPFNASVLFGITLTLIPIAFLFDQCFYRCDYEEKIIPTGKKKLT